MVERQWLILSNLFPGPIFMNGSLQGRSRHVPLCRERLQRVKVFWHALMSNEELSGRKGTSVYQKQARAFIRTLAKFGELWRSHNAIFTRTSPTFTRVPAKFSHIQQCSCEGAFSMRVAFRMCPKHWVTSIM